MTKRTPDPTEVPDDEAALADPSASGTNPYTTPDFDGIQDPDAVAEE